MTDLGEALPNPPTDEEWRRLYDAAVAYRDAAPWDWMSEEEMFGVQDPETGTPYYACVLGALGEMRALVLYEGVEGLAGLWKMRLEPLEGPMDTLMLQRCLMASFEDREDQEKPDLEVIKRLGLKFRGRGAWPQFRSYLPGYAPWFVTGAQARFLAVALEQALDVARRVQDDAVSLPPALPEGGEYLVRVQTEGGEWQDVLKSPEPLQEAESPAGTVDIERALNMRRTLPKTRGILEMDAFVSPSGVRGEDGRRPYFPTVLLAGDHDSGRILGTELSHPGSVAQDFGEMFLTMLETLAMLPARVEVGNEQAKAWLKPFAAPVGVRVSVVRSLKALGPARSELALFLGIGPGGLDLMALAEEALEEPEPPPARRPRRKASGAARGANSTAPVYQLKITLREARPPIWRRIQVPGDVRLDVLHHIIQAAMGWTDSHLHSFEIDGERYSAPVADLEMQNERRFRLDQLVPEAGGRFAYEYDFGDGWDHEVRVEKILPPQPGVPLPLCVTGRRACPPEDCGGVWGYGGLLEALGDSNHPEHEAMTEWLEEPFDPEAFSCDEVNQRLKRAV